MASCRKLWPLPFVLHPLHHRFRRCPICCQWHRMHITNPHQCRNIRFVGLGGQRVTEEDDCLHFALCNTPADNEVATFGTMNNLLNLQVKLLDQKRTRVAGGNKRMAAEEVDVFSHELDQVRFLFVVGDKGDHGHSLSVPCLRALDLLAHDKVFCSCGDDGKAEEFLGGHGVLLSSAPYTMDGVQLIDPTFQDAAVVDEV